jgi:hypothetical protein
LGIVALCVGIATWVPSGVAASEPATADAVPFVGTFTVECTQGNPSPGGVCDHHHSYPGAMDLDLPVGTPVRAAGPGTVVFVNSTCAVGDTGCQSGAGRWVGVTHPDGKSSRYLHLQSVSVSVGQAVTTGTVVGTSGITGNAAVNPHLHYDEQKPLGTRASMGEMYACHGSSLVVYPDVLGETQWADVPYGSPIRNDGYGCLGGVFLDVPPSHAFHDEIGWLVEAGITEGYPDGTFRPLEQVSRQAMSAWLHRRAGAPPGPFADPALADVPPSHPFAAEIWWMVATGRANAYPDGTYKPTTCVTRQAMAAFLHREVGSPITNGPTFTDVPVDHAFYEPIAWMALQGITTGYPDGSFRPQDCVTRQSGAAFLSRLFG